MLDDTFPIRLSIPRPAVSVCRKKDSPRY